MVKVNKSGPQFVGTLGKEAKKSTKVVDHINELKKDIGKCVKKFRNFAPAGFEFTTSNFPHICFLSQDRMVFSVNSVNSNVTVNAKTGTVTNCVCSSTKDLETVLKVCEQLSNSFN